jgi:tRNA threonylcarbamoyladenosine biosynthesis protein TsaE
MRITTQSDDETRRLGERLGALLQPGDVVGLTGQLGAGKTTLSQGIGAGLGVEEPVSSPTFALVHEYQGRYPVWHLDTYRVGSLDELIDLSWDDLLAGGGVILVEWPQRIEAALPAERLDITLRYVDEDTRELALTPYGPRMTAVLEQLASDWGEQESGLASAPA